MQVQVDIRKIQEGGRISVNKILKKYNVDEGGHCIVEDHGNGSFTVTPARIEKRSFCSKK